MANIYSFKHYRDFLNKTLFPKGLYRQNSLNIRNLTNKLGYKSPSLLSMILNGERHPSDEMVEKLSDHLNLASSESRYFKLLVKFEKQKEKGKDPSGTLREIDQILDSTKKVKRRLISLADFEYVAQWYYLVIKQLVETNSFKEDPLWIVKKLRNKVAVHQVKKAIKHLLEIGALERDENNNLIKNYTISTPDETPSTALKQHHIGMMERAQEAIEEQDVNERCFQGLTFRFNKEKITEAKKDIVNFVDDFNDKYFADAGEDVYQLNVQLFSHTIKRQSDIENDLGELLQ